MTENAIETKATARRAYIAGLRNLALLLEEVEYIPTPYTGAVKNTDRLNVFGADSTTLEVLLNRVGPPVSVELRTPSAWMVWHLDGVAVQLLVPAEQVFTRVATGTWCRIGDERREQVEWVLAERFQPATDGAA